MIHSKNMSPSAFNSAQACDAHFQGEKSDRYGKDGQGRLDRMQKIAEKRDRIQKRMHNTEDTREAKGKRGENKTIRRENRYSYTKGQHGMYRPKSRARCNCQMLFSACVTSQCHAGHIRLHLRLAQPCQVHFGCFPHSSPLIPRLRRPH
jgi:hypothetical protein